MEKFYGKELIIDLHNCDVSKFNRTDLDIFFEELCILLKMKKCERYWWDDYNVPIKERQTDPKLKGTSAIQFIMTSNITVHTLDILERVYINIFSCKNFNTKDASDFCKGYFEGKIINKVVVNRI